MQRFGAFVKLITNVSPYRTLTVANYKPFI